MSSRYILSMFGVACILTGCGTTESGGGGVPDNGGNRYGKNSTSSMTTSTTTTETTTTTTTTTTTLCPPNPYEGSKSDADMCFCQMAGNAECNESPCQCPQGCKPLVKNNDSSTIVNFKSARGCANKTALLTLPQVYLSGMTNARKMCPDGLEQLLTTLLQDGFLAYQSEVHEETVMQCIHQEWHISVPYLHLHTICQNGTIDGMPNDNNAFCGTMQEVTDAEKVAGKFMRQLAASDVEQSMMV